MQFMRNMENVVKYFKMGEAIINASCNMIYFPNRKSLVVPFFKMYNLFVVLQDGRQLTSRILAVPISK